jgi:hypothetical protein
MNLEAYILMIAVMVIGYLMLTDEDEDEDL